MGKCPAPCDGSEPLDAYNTRAAQAFNRAKRQYRGATRSLVLDNGLKVRPMVLPDRFLDHGKPPEMYKAAGLASDGIVATVFAALGREIDSASADRA